MRICPVCETKFAIPTHAPAKGKTYCSDKCLASASYKRLIMARQKKCKGCDSTTVRWDATYCSRQCAAIHIHALRCVIVHVPRDQVRAIVKPAPKVKMRTFYAGRCAHCGENFVALRQSTPPVYCSVACGRRAAGQRYKSVRHRAFVENVYRYKVFERDNYVCQLCMKPCRIDADTQDMQGPSIDHIVALANGGEHSMANVQTAHRLCNSLKSDRVDYVLPLSA